MKYLPILVLSCISIAGCATYPIGKDDLCREMATFANSTQPGASHMVSLETSWGSSNIHPGAIVSRDCNPNEYAPGVILCHYLMDNSAAEFAENNYSRAAACLANSPTKGRDEANYEDIDAKVSAYGGKGGAFGVRRGIKVTVEFKPNTEHGTMQLNIRADAR